VGGRDAAALAGVLAAGAGLFTRGLDGRTSYDEGVYLASLDALRHGQELGRDVFASQPPGFYLLLRLVALGAGRPVHDMRIGMLVIALVGVAAAYFVGRRFAGISGGLAAGALVVAAPPYAAEAPRVAADTPAVALALCTLAAAAYGLRRDSLWGPAAAGVLAAAAIATKLLVLPVIVPLAVLAWQRRIGARAAVALVAGVAAVAAVIAGIYAGVLPDLWRDAVDFHRDARSTGIGESAGSRVVDYFSLRTPTTWVALAGALAAVLFRRQLASWAWVAAAIGFLLLQAPLLDHHFVLLAAALGVAAGTSLTSLPGRLALAGLAIALIGATAGWIQDYRQIGRSSPPEPAEIRAAADALRALIRPNELVAADLPIVAYLADRRLPGDLVDTSAVRFATASLTRQEVLSAPARVYVVGREFEGFVRPGPDLRLVRRFGSIRILVRR
jgi:4-amino-4-deoxy-L-arabinose transferase-like glycosyltransferase